MSRVLVLDTGPAGKIAHPRIAPDLSHWLLTSLAAGDTIVLPEIVDYELRRNFLLEIARGHYTFRRSLERLDQLRTTLAFLPLNSAAMIQAAELWAYMRAKGKPTADRQALDGDVILAAQALQVAGIVVTENIGHLAELTEARTWQEL